MNNVPGSLKFGLNISAKKAASLNGQPISTLSRPSPTTTKPPSKQPLFAEEDDDDNDNPTTESAARAKVNASIKKAQSHMDKVAAKEYEKVLQEDPNAFDYDGVYDDMKKTEERRKKGAQEAEGDAKKVRESVVQPVPSSLSVLNNLFTLTAPLHRQPPPIRPRQKSRAAPNPRTQDPTGTGRGKGEIRRDRFRKICHVRLQEADGGTEGD